MVFFKERTCEKERQKCELSWLEKKAGGVCRHISSVKVGGQGTYAASLSEIMWL